MELALYAPGLGYYSAGMHKFGAAGDFVTAPEISALFGQALAQQAAQVLGLTAGNILEIGPGSGRLAFDLLSELERLGQLPERYFLLEVSADLRQRQQHLLARFAAASRVAGHPARFLLRTDHRQRGARCDAGTPRRLG